VGDRSVDVKWPVLEGDVQIISARVLHNQAECVPEGPLSDVPIVGGGDVPTTKARFVGSSLLQRNENVVKTNCVVPQRVTTFCFRWVDHTF